MATTVLSIAGHIDVTQFWPTGEADADTTKILVTVGADSFRLQRPDDAAPAPTTLYQRAYQRGERLAGGGHKHEPLVDAQQRITVRLQRIDAPELHAAPGAIRNKTLAGLGWYQAYRQRQAETAVSKLRTHLLRMAADNTRLPCEFVARLDDARGPGDAIDKYGRFVGDILVGKKQENLNLWLLREGWAIVALYDSMQLDEIDETLQAWADGAGAGIRPHYRAAFEPFEFLVYRKPGADTQPERDRAPFIHPKFFRRYITWWAHRGAGNIDMSFADYLASRQERVWHLPEFRAALEAGNGRTAPTYELHDPQADGDAVGWPPEAFIFEEAAAALYADIGGEPTKLGAAHWGA
jgi:endonuclease YncB( thermonuclease family)